MGIYIGSVLIPYYGLSIVLGITVAALCGWFMMKKASLNYDDFIIVAGCVGLGALIGAKILWMLVAKDKIQWNRILEMEYLSTLMSGGFVFFGGIFGGFLGLYFAYKRFGIPAGRYASAGIPCIPIAHAFGRLGCSAVGCCYGIKYNGPGAIVYHYSRIAPNNVSLFPVQKVEAAAEFGIALCLMTFLSNCGQERRENGSSVLLYLFVYSMLRFGLEYFRGDDLERGKLFGLFTSQWISVGIVMGILVLVIWKKERRKTF